MIAGGFVLGEVLALPAVEISAALTVILISEVLLMCRKGRSLWIGLLLFVVFCGFFRLSEKREALEQIRRLHLEEKREIAATGILASLEKGEFGYSGELTGTEILIDGTEKALGTVSVSFPFAPEAEVGDCIKVSGEWDVYGEAGNPGEFDYRSYYESRGICYRLKAEQIECLSGRDYVSGILHDIRQRAGKVLEKSGGDASGIFKAMLLGDKQELPSHIYELYQKNGISHILAISGLHISMLGMGLYRLLGKAGLGKRSSGVVAGIWIMAYGQMTGFSPSTRRAVIMFLVSVLASCIGRTYDLLSGLSLSALIILWENPLALTQSGVQLSFLAVAGIGGLGQVCSAAGFGRGKTGKTVVGGMAVQAATVPAILYHFFEYPPYGLFLNFLVIPLMAYVMVSALLCLAAGLVWQEAGRFFAGTGYYILKLYEGLCLFMEKLPGSSLVIGRPAAWKLAGYLLLSWLLYRGILMLRDSRRKKMWTVIIGICMVAILAPAWVQPDQVRVTYLDVGQGDGILVEMGGCRILLDGGSADRKQLGEQILDPFLQSRGIGTLDYAIVSHCDRDHMSGVEWLLEQGKTKVDTVVLSEAGREEEDQKRLADLARQAGARVVSMQEGDRIGSGKAILRCLYPWRGAEPGDKNEQSLVLRLDCGEISFLFTGDIGKETEIQILNHKESSGRLENVTVLKTAHHGSSGSSGKEFLTAVSPEMAVISYGEGNSYGHPAEDTVKRLQETGCRIYETAHTGAVMMETDGRWLRIWTYR